MTGFEIAASIIGSWFAIDKVAIYFKSLRKNGNEANQQQTVKIENSPLASTSGKRICDFHMELNNTLLNLKRDTEDIREEQVVMQKDIREITAGSLNTHKKLDIIIEHFQIKRW